MTWLALLLVFGCVAAILALMLGQLRAPSGRLSDYGKATPGPIGWVTPFTAMVATTSIIEHVDGSLLDGAGLGAAFGLLAFLCSMGGSGVRWVVDLASSAIGAVATVTTVVGYLSGSDCAPDSLAQRLAEVVAMAAFFAFGLIHTALAHPHNLAKVGAAAFAATDVLVFLASPLGAPLSDKGWILSIIAAALLGAASGAFPDLAMILLATGVGLTQIGVTATLGDACSLPGTSSSVTMLAGFAAVFLLLRVIGSLVRR